MSKEELIKYVAALRPKISEMSTEELEQVFAMIWQNGILTQQFHDINKSILYWCRHPESRKILKEEAITHLADCWCQMEIMARMFGLTERQIAESRVLAFERLKDHLFHEILPIIQKGKSQKGILQIKSEDKTECERSRNVILKHALGNVITLFELDKAMGHVNSCVNCKKWLNEDFRQVKKK